jgi:uncharacterized membrane protein
MRSGTLAAALLVALIFVGLAWELFLAPLAPGGSWWVLKIVPLMIALPGVLRERRYTLQWSTLVIWLYAAEGATRAYTDRGMSAGLAALELALALAYFGAAVATLRSSPRRATSATPTPPAPRSPG